MGAIDQVAKSYITLLKAGSIYGMNAQVLDTTGSLFIHLQKKYSDRHEQRENMI